MNQEPLVRLTQESRWTNRVLLAVLSLALLLAGALLWGSMRILAQEHSKLDFEFRELIGYIDSQEDFLRQLHQQSAALDQIPMTREALIHEQPSLDGWDARLFEGQESVVDLPFTLACSPPYLCPNASERVRALGAYLADFYATFWASSFFPSATAFLVSSAADINVSVPAIGAAAGYEPLSVDVFRNTTSVVRSMLLNGTVKPIQSTHTGDSAEALSVRWFSVPGSPNKMVAVLPAGFAPDLWTSPFTLPVDAFFATLLSRNKLNVFKHSADGSLGHSFWLLNKDEGVLIGSGDVPVVAGDGLSLTAQGLAWKGQDPDGIWTGIFLISYSSFFSANRSLLAGGVIAVVLLLLSGLWYSRWYKQSIIEPALDGQRQMMESEAFQRTLIQTAPVGLCVLNRDTGGVIFSNSIAAQWLSGGENNSEHLTLYQALERICKLETAGVLSHACIVGGRDLSVAYAPSVYRDQPAMVCAFIDLTYRVQIEQELERAKQAADEASEAKSLFLSTMSHEIRTPLYGLQGTIELLAETRLDPQQRVYVNRIEEASHMLLQLISDILDMSRIEAGQLSLSVGEFSPLELVQNCVSSYAGMAQKKGLAIFSSIAPDVPQVVQGDAVRIRQILSNLISNAIKFTDVGRVVVRVYLLDQGAELTRLRLEVCDTGIGIEPGQQEKLFQPFFSVQGGAHTLHGAGLGLSICQRLAQLMGTSIQVRSEYQIGSCFSFDVDFSVLTDELRQPQLKGAVIVVNTPYELLTQNVGAWLQRWGANVVSAEILSMQSGTNSVWLDIFMHQSSRPSTWHGLYLSVAPEQGESTHPEIEGHSLLSIGFGLERILFQRDGEHVQEEAVAVDSLNLSVLVAEDSPINQMTMRDQLEQLGCKVSIAEDGEDALAIWDMAPHDVILTDVNMPRMNGYELVKTLRAEGVKCMIIGITANAMADEEQRCLSAGMDVCLVKPIRLEALAQVLKRCKGGQVSEALSSKEEGVTLKALVIPDKYREVFISTMQKDIQELSDALHINNVEKIGFTLHRISGALVAVDYFDFLQKIQNLEKLLISEGLSDSVYSEVENLCLSLKNLVDTV